MLDLSKILNFARLLNKFQRVTRVVRATSEDRWENDVEHNYHLAMLAWYITEKHNPLLNRDLVLKYALVHDFVEAYAGDTYIYTTDKKKKNNKKSREKKAAARLKKELPEFRELHELIHGYEERNDEESRFVYALDKIQPLLNIFLDGGRTWKEKGITIQMLIDHKKDKVALSPHVASCFNEIVVLLKKNEWRLFGKKSSPRHVRS